MGLGGVLHMPAAREMYGIRGNVVHYTLYCRSEELCAHALQRVCVCVCVYVCVCVCVCVCVNSRPKAERHPYRPTTRDPKPYVVLDRSFRINFRQP